MSDAITKTSSRWTDMTGSLEFLYGAVLVTQLPIAMGYLRRIWNAGHYQFAVLLIPIVIVMMKSRLEDLKTSAPGARPIVIFWMGVTALFMVLTTFVAPVFWILSFMSLVWCYVYDKYGKSGIAAILPLWLLLVIVVPLPRGLDNLLVTRMQLVASEFASWILDALGLIHFRNGVVLVTKTEQFMTEEACSGIRSLFSSLAAIGLYCIYKRYGLLRSAFNLIQTVFWVVVGNAIRIATVVWVADNWTTAIAHGRPHESLGLAIFMMIILLVVSTDRILQVLLDMRPRPPEASAEAFQDGVIDVAVKVPRNKNLSVFQRWILPGFILFGLFLAFCGVRLMTVKSDGILRNPLFDLPPFPISAGKDLPDEIGAWKLIVFEPIDRGEDVILAAQSYTWTYQNGAVQVVLSVDGPWEFWHDITACYRGIGWTTDTTHNFGTKSTIDNNPTANRNHSRIELSRVTGERALVFFAQHDLSGREVRPSMLGGLVSLELMKLNFLQRVRTIFGIQSKFNAGLQQYRLPLSTIQVYCGNSGGLTKPQIAEIEQFYFQARQLLIASPRFDHE